MDLLDTDILIDIQRGYDPALSWFHDLKELPTVPGIVVMELIQAAKDSRQVRDALKLTAPFSVIWPTGTDGRRALSDFTAFHLSHGLGLLDSWIAACAIGLPAPLCTFNLKHYQMIPGLVTRQPYTRN